MFKYATKKQNIPVANQGTDTADFMSLPSVGSDDLGFEQLSALSPKNDGAQYASSYDLPKTLTIYKPRLAVLSIKNSKEVTLIDIPKDDGK